MRRGIARKAEVWEVRRGKVEVKKPCGRRGDLLLIRKYTFRLDVI